MNEFDASGNNFQEILCFNQIRCKQTANKERYKKFHFLSKSWDKGHS